MLSSYITAKRYQTTKSKCKRIMSYNKVQVLKDNISAIRTAFALTDSNRTATEEELAILQNTAVSAA